MKKEKDINYYRRLLHIDSIALLVVTIIFAVINILFMGKGYDNAVPIFLKSIMFAIFSIIVICNKKELKKFIGIFTIIISGLMLITSLGDWSLFGIVYILLGVFMLIHSILYLKKFKDYNPQTEYLDESSVTETKIKYIVLLPFCLTILFAILGIISKQGILGLSWYSIVILIVNIVSIILCIVLHSKKIRSSLVYVILVISIMITTFNGIFLMEEIKNNKKEDNNSEEILITYAQELEDEFSDEIMYVGNLKNLSIEITKENIVTLTEYLNVISKNKYISKNLFYLDELTEKGYSCDGYSILNFKDVSYTEEYNYNLENRYDVESMEYYFDVKSYVKCVGEHIYMTSGFDDNLLK